MIRLTQRRGDAKGIRLAVVWSGHWWSRRFIITVAFTLPTLSVSVALLEIRFWVLVSTVPRRPGGGSRTYCQFSLLLRQSHEDHAVRWHGLELQLLVVLAETALLPQIGDLQSDRTI